MLLNRIRFALLLLGDRLVAAGIARGRLHCFVVEAEQPAAALRAELDARKIRPRTAAIGLARASVTVKPIELPAVAGDARNMVRFELERHVPFGADDTPFDFTLLPRVGESAGVTSGARLVLLVAADRRVVDGALRVAQETGLKAASITVAAHDLLALVTPPRRQRVVWIHRAGADVELLFLTGSTLVLSRSITAEDDAAIADEIARSLGVVRWRRCDALWRSGDVAAPSAPTWSPLTQFGVPVTDPPYTKPARRFLTTINQEARGALQLALGVAMARRGRPLDLIPDAMRARHVTRGQLVTMATATAAIALSIGALLAPGYRDQQRLKQLSTAIARLDPEVRAVERVSQELERKQKLLAMIQALEAGAIKPLPVMRELTELVPNDAWLTLLSMDANGVELTGQAASASALIPLLENSPRLERVEFASPVTRGRDKEQFRIHAKWEGPPGRVIAVEAGAAPAAAPPPVPAPPPASGGAPASAPNTGAARPGRGAVMSPLESEVNNDGAPPARRGPGERRR